MLYARLLPGEPLHADFDAVWFLIYRLRSIVPQSDTRSFLMNSEPNNIIVSMYLPRLYVACFISPPARKGDTRPCIVSEVGPTIRNSRLSCEGVIFRFYGTGTRVPRDGSLHT